MPLSQPLHRRGGDGEGAAPRWRSAIGRCVRPALLASLLAALMLASATVPVRATTAPAADDPSRLCEDAIRSAALHHQLPADLLLAIGIRESGRPDPLTGRARPWPWSVQAAEQSYYFPSRDAAVKWVQDARARGLASIDTGCMQVNLFYHPQAFETVDAAFDPVRNADYAARFLQQLHAEVGDWGKAIGFYHSRTADLAEPYQQSVQRLTGHGLPADKAAPPVSPLALLGAAWRATTDPLPAAPGSAGNGWETLLHRPEPPPGSPHVHLARVAQPTLEKVSRLAAR